MIPFGEWRPDVSDYNADYTSVATNVLPRADGYGPFKDEVAFSSALPAACRGYYYAKKSDGTIVIFAGTSTRLYRMNNTDFSWVPISKVVALTSISNASPAVFTLASHGLVANDALVLSTSSGLPTGLTVGTVYYVISAGLTANAFEVSTTVGGAAVNTSSAGSGTHSMTNYYSALSLTAQWQFAQFGNLVFATQANVVLQVYDMSTAVAFSDCAGSPPQAAYIAVVGRFLVLSGLLSTPYRIQWSGLNATTTWTSGTNQSDYQDLPDGGIVRGVAGGEIGVIFQDGSIRRMAYTPGSPVIFQIDRIAEDHGIFAPYALIRDGDRVFYPSSEGFYEMFATGTPRPIGKEKIDRTILEDIDKSNLQLFIGAADPKASRVYWAYKSISGQAALFDKLLIYDWGLQRFSTANIIGEYLANLSQPGVTLDALDSVSGSIDALVTPLDDFSSGSLPALGIVNSDHKVGFFSGDNLEATVETPENGTEGQRLRINGFLPITDAGGGCGAISYRENLQDTRTWTSEVVINSRGMIPANRSSRYARARLRIPSATTWTYAKGVEPVANQIGKR